MLERQRWRTVWLRPSDADAWVQGFLLLEPPRLTCWLITAEQLPCPTRLDIQVAPGQPLAGTRITARVHASANSGVWSRAWAELRWAPTEQAASTSTQTRCWQVPMISPGPAPPMPPS